MIHLCVAESVAQQRDYVMNCRLWFCHGRTWGLCSPSGLWDSPWPAATYLHRTADPSVTGQLTGKGRDDSCSSWARLPKEDYRAVQLLTILAVLDQFLSSTGHLAGSLVTFYSFILVFKPCVQEWPRQRWGSNEITRDRLAHTYPAGEWRSLSLHSDWSNRCTMWRRGVRSCSRPPWEWVSPLKWVTRPQLDHHP